MLGLAVTLIVLCGVRTDYQSVATAIDRRMYPPPGQLIDVGGYRLHINCIGQGSPTVILESGLQATSSLWGRVQPNVAGTTRVCAYDRAGVGWSEPASAPRMLGRSPANFTYYSVTRELLAPTCSLGIHMVASTCVCTRPHILMRSPGWCLWTPATPISGSEHRLIRRAIKSCG